MTYRWLLFDADGTLYDFERAQDGALRALYSELDLPLTPQSLACYHTVNREVWAQFERGELAADVLSERRFSRLFETLGVPGDAPRASAAYLEHLGRGTHLIEGAASLVTTLRERYQLAILTNGLSAVQRPRFAASAIGHLFDPVIISEEHGTAKPDPAIFDAALEAMGSPDREQVLMIGDSLSSDIKGGIDYGIDTCWYNPRGKSAPQGLAIEHEIGALDELLALLDRA